MQTFSFQLLYLIVLSTTQKPLTFLIVCRKIVPTKILDQTLPRTRRNQTGSPLRLLLPSFFGGWETWQMPLVRSSLFPEVYTLFRKIARYAPPLIHYLQHSQAVQRTNANQHVIEPSVPKVKVGLGAVRCQPAKTARAWCIARVAIGTSENWDWQGWQILSARSALSDEV